VHVIDEDLGKSGAGSIERHGFQKLIAEIGQCWTRGQPRRFTFGPQQSRLASAS
jgi:hypothetical protein